MILSVVLTHQGKPNSTATIDLSRPARHWARLKSGAQGTLGLHVFAAKYGDWTYGILRFTNGVVTRDGTGFCGTVYAETLQVTVNRRQVMLMLPPKFKREAFLFRPRGTLQVPFYFHSRTDSAQPPQEMLDALALKVNPMIGPNGYGPTNSLQPDIDKRETGLRYNNITANLRIVDAGLSDFYNAPAENLAFEYKLAGPYAIEGYPNGYAHGGFGIDPSHGWEMVPEAVQMHALLHRANMHRQFCDAIDAETGDPISLYSWTKAPGRDLMKGQPGRESEVELLCFLEGNYEQRRYPVFNGPVNRTSYEDRLWSYRPNDLAHLIRLLRHTIPVIDYGGRHPAAMCARFDLLMVAEDARYQQWSDRADELVRPSYPGEWVPQTLARVLQDPPHHGHPRLDRAAAWMAYTGATVLKYFNRPPAWREWGANMLRAILMHQDKLGLSHRDEGNIGAFPPGGRGTQTFHSALLGIGAFALYKQIGDQTKWPEAIENMARALYCTHEPIVYGQGYQYGPAHWGMSELNGQELDQIQWLGEGDPAHALAFMGLMARGPNRDYWIDRSLKYNLPHSSRMARLEWFRACKERSWTAEMHSAMEGVRG